MSDNIHPDVQAALAAVLTAAMGQLLGDLQQEIRRLLAPQAAHNAQDSSDVSSVPITVDPAIQATINATLDTVVTQRIPYFQQQVTSVLNAQTLPASSSSDVVDVAMTENGQEKGAQEGVDSEMDLESQEDDETDMDSETEPESEGEMQTRIDELDGVREAALAPYRNKHYPDCLWAGTTYRRKTYEPRWKPTQEPSSLLNEAEIREWENSHREAFSHRAFENLTRKQANAIESRKERSTRELKDLDNLSEWRKHQGLEAPEAIAGFKTPKRHNQDSKNTYEKARMTIPARNREELQKLKHKLWQLLNSKDVISKLPTRKPDDHDDDNDEPGKEQGVAQTSAPIPVS